MKHRAAGAALLLVAAIATAQAPDACCPTGPGWRQPGCVNVLAHTYCCPDDYCGKKMPVTRSICKYCKDDYCGKKMPVTPSMCEYRKDDYCGKAAPCVRIICGPWYRCGAPPCGPKRLPAPLGGEGQGVSGERPGATSHP